MGIRTYRPHTPGLRQRISHTYEEITKDTPEKSLTQPMRKRGGRNNQGRLTMRHRGGGHKQRYRIIDFKRDKRGVVATVAAIEYDPCRTARIALLEYKDGERRYIIAPNGLKVGATLNAGPDVPVEVGNALPLRNVPLGYPIHNVEMLIGRGGQIVRSAGSAAELTAKEGDYGLVRLPSGELRKIHLNCYATLGQVSNSERENISLGKAGRTRHLGWRPKVRGMVMNPVDHPMGGGQGKSKGGGGRQHPCSPWGQLAKGLKTRQKHKWTDKFIVQRRSAKKKKA